MQSSGGGSTGGKVRRGVTLPSADDLARLLVELNALNAQDYWDMPLPRVWRVWKAVEAMQKRQYERNKKAADAMKERVGMRQLPRRNSRR